MVACKISLLAAARAWSSARDDRVSCIKGFIGLGLELYTRYLNS